jgi:hypothetical protein
VLQERNRVAGDENRIPQHPSCATRIEEPAGSSPVCSSLRASFPRVDWAQCDDPCQINGDASSPQREIYPAIAGLTGCTAIPGAGISCGAGIFRSGPESPAPVAREETDHSPVHPVRGTTGRGSVHTLSPFPDPPESSVGERSIREM